MNGAVNLRQILSDMEPITIKLITQVVLSKDSDEQKKGDIIEGGTEKISIITKDFFYSDLY